MASTEYQVAFTSGRKLTGTEIKTLAQDTIMHYGVWTVRENLTEVLAQTVNIPEHDLESHVQYTRMREAVAIQANRVCRLFGFEPAFADPGDI